MIALRFLLPFIAPVVVALAGLGFNLWREYTLRTQHEADITQLKEDHSGQISLLHAGYRLQGAAEAVRQREANLKASQDAEAERAKADAELASMQVELDKLKTEASKDVHAQRPAFSIDAIRRLNTLRGRVRPDS